MTPETFDAIAGGVCALLAIACALAALRAALQEPGPSNKEAPVAAQPKKQTTRAVSRLAAKVLRGGYRPTAAEIRTLAACALGQDETPAPKKVARKVRP